MTGSAGLADHHRNQLRASGISDEVISRRGYSTLDRRGNADASQRRKLKALGFSKKAWDDDQRFPGLLIPVYGPTGRLASHRYRPDRPRTDGKNRAVKYESPTGQASRIDVHPFHQDSIADPTVPLIITEGHKKADSITTAARAEGFEVAVAAIDGVFNWRGRHGTLGDWEDICLRRRAVHIVFDADAATNRNVASAMHRLGQWLKSKGAKVSYVVSPEVNGDGKTGADDYLAAGITLRSLLAVGQSRPPDPGAADDSLTDSRLAERVAREVLEDNYRWCQALSGWFCWTGARWERGSEEEVLERVRVHLQTLHKDAIDSRAPVDRLRAMAGLQQIGRARSILAFTKGIDGVLTRHDEFDQHPDLLNCRNGVVDLRTGELMDPDPDLLLTKLVPVEYLPSASHEDWGKALEAMPDPETRDYLQVLMGQGATGHRPAEDRLTVAVGGGENGKSTLFGACRAALGDYALVASHRALMGDAKNHPTELMDFMGARFVMVEETPERGRLNTVALKTIIGTPFITARRMHKDSVEFATTHTAVINTNYLPTVDETDHGTWRRLSAIVFPLRYVNDPRRSNERQGDRGLRERLINGTPQQQAVLAWIVQGAVRWYADGRILPPLPQKVRADTAAWRRDNDLIAGFVGEVLTFDEGYHITQADMIEAFNAYLQEHGQAKWSDKTFVSRFAGHDCVTGHGIKKVENVSPDGVHGQRSQSVHASRAWQVGRSRARSWVGVKFRSDYDAGGLSPAHSRAIG